jgi:hypothetical protein
MRIPDGCYLVLIQCAMCHVLYHTMVVRCHDQAGGHGVKLDFPQARGGVTIRSTTSHLQTDNYQHETDNYQQAPVYFLCANSYGFDSPDARPVGLDGTGGNGLRPSFPQGERQNKPALKPTIYQHDSKFVSRLPTVKSSCPI